MTKYFLEYREKIQRNIGRDDIDSQNKIVDSFNEAQQVIAARTEIKSLQTTTSVYLDEDVYAYELDTIDMQDLQHLYAINLNDGTMYYPPMEYITKPVWDSEIKPFIHTLTGKPKIFTFFDDTLYFSNVPDSSSYYIDLSFSFWPASVIDDLSLVDLTSFDPALIALATAYAWLKLEEVDLYDSWLAEATRSITMYDKDLKNVVDFKGKSFSRRNARDGADYWLDPFRRKM